jgi:predicted nuclease with TOPRIM domain
MEKKNALLQPIFRDLKSAIRFMTFTDEYKAIKDFLDNRTLLLQEFGGQSDSAACKEALGLLEREYARLIAKQRQESQGNATRKLKTLKKRLEDMFQLLSLWT